jgi:hypothetical protein
MRGLSALGTDAPPPLRCPVCGCELIDRRARHGLRDYFHFLRGRYPFRCRRCGKEFYLPHRGTRHQSLFN